MKKAIPKMRGGKRPGSGRKPTGRDPARTIRLSDEFIATVDTWAAQQDDSPNRSEAIRRLVELGLTVKTEERPKSEDTKRRQKTKQRARELAGAVVDEMTDTTASPENQADRKRRLIKGPEEFQGVRRDRPNRK
jgi:Arc/MetJ-type ribon-helix-helix transcriptional regulator